MKYSEVSERTTLRIQDTEPTGSVGTGLTDWEGATSLNYWHDGGRTYVLGVGEYENSEMVVAHGIRTAEQVVADYLAEVGPSPIGAVE